MILVLGRIRIIVSCIFYIRACMSMEKKMYINYSAFFSYLILRGIRAVQFQEGNKEIGGFGCG